MPIAAILSLLLFVPGVLGESYKYLFFILILVLLLLIYYTTIGRKKYLELKEV